MAASVLTFTIDCLPQVAQMETSFFFEEDHAANGGRRLGKVGTDTALIPGLRA